MTRAQLFTVAVFIFVSRHQLEAQSFRVQLAAYNEHQPDSFFKERGVDYYTETVDVAGIYWYSAGQFPTREAAETVHQDAVNKGFAYALIIDEEEQRVLAAADCPYVRDGVVFVHDPGTDPNEHTIYFDLGKSGLNEAAKLKLEEVYQKMKKTPSLTLKIHGFTDGVGDGTANMKLAAGRSRSARDYLIYKGVRADRMFMEVFGEAEPAAPNAEDDGSNSGKGRDLPENRKWNRRVTLTFEMPQKASKAVKEH